MAAPHSHVNAFASTPQTFLRSSVPISPLSACCSEWRAWYKGFSGMKWSRHRFKDAWYLKAFERNMQGCVLLSRSGVHVERRWAPLFSALSSAPQGLGFCEIGLHPSASPCPIFSFDFGKSTDFPRPQLSWCLRLLRFTPCPTTRDPRSSQVAHDSIPGLVSHALASLVKSFS